MITLKHRTASGRLDALWEFCGERRALELVFRLGHAKPLALTVPVCAVDNPVLLSHPIMRLDSSSWRVLPMIWIVGESGRFAQLDCARKGASTPCELHRSIGGATHLVLTHAPDDVDLELESLSL